MPETKDTMLGLLRRTGPATAELLDPETGKVFGFNFAAAADPDRGIYVGMQSGREIADGIFLPEPKDD